VPDTVGVGEGARHPVCYEIIARYEGARHRAVEVHHERKLIDILGPCVTRTLGTVCSQSC
jgi:sarcosine oxidase gamma subunit